jgi:steroid 5-alpha reductase family enzyme
MIIADFMGVLTSNLLCFALLWLFFYNFSRISWIDVLWSGSIGLWSLFHLREAFLFDYGASALILSLITLCWSGRLTFHLAKRLSSNKSEDRRYEEIKQANPSAWKRKSFVIFLMNAFLVSLLLIPQRLVILDINSKEPKFLQILGFVISLLSIAGESLADSQLKNFLKINQGKTCQVGLWKYSRHPNYFF